MTRRLRIAVIVAAIVATLVGAGLVALPEVVRRVAVTQLRGLTKRDVGLDDVDLNLFTGRVALKGFRLAQKDARETALGFERLDVGLSLPSLLWKHARVTEIRLVAPQIHVTRTGPQTYDFSDLLALIPPADPNAPKSAWVVTIDRLVLERGAIVARDQVTVPPTEWRVGPLTLDGGDITTRPGGRSGRLALRTIINGARLAVDATQIAVAPAAAATVAVALDDFALPLVTPYVPANVLAVPRAGVARIALTLTVAPPTDGVPQTTVSGDIGVERLEVVRREADAPFFTLGRLGLKIARADLASREVVVGDLALDGLTLDAARGRDGAIDLTSLIVPAAAAPAAPAPPAKPMLVVLERFSLANSGVRFRDGAVTPAADWRLTQLAATAEKISTAPDAAAGAYTLGARINGAKLAVSDGTVRLQPLAVGGRVALTGVDLAWAAPYLPANLPVTPPTGRFGATLAFDVSPTPVLAGTITGDLQVDALGVTHKSSAPLATLNRAQVKIAGADLGTRTFRLGVVDLDALDVRAQRAPDGAIDLVTAFTGPAGPAPPSPPATAPPAAPKAPAPAAAPAPPPLTLQIDSLFLRRTAVTLTDRAVTPAAVLAVTDWSLTLRDFTWPNTRASQVETALTLPGGGRFTLKGAPRLTPFEADVEMSLRNATPEPFAPYLPFKARLEGRFSGNTRAQVRMTPAGIMARAVGDNWGENLAVRDPDAPAGSAPPLRIDRMALDGVDFAWPTGARVARVTITKPDARAIRTKDGIDLTALFAFRPVVPATTTPALPTPPSATPAPPTQPPGTPAEAAPFALAIDAFVLEDGFARFTDRTTEPAFAESISRLRITLDGISNAPGRRATLAMSATVGGAATLETRGQVAPLGVLFADTVTELRNYALPSVNPYMNQAIAWIVEQGTLSATVRAHVENGALDVKNTFDVRRLHVAKAPGHDTAKQKLGLPLGMIVALITDRHNGFKTDIPIAGRLDNPQFAWSDAIWTAVKNVLVNVAAAPFRAIGRLFTGRDNTIDRMEVEPVTFAAGSAALGPDTERHLIRVADFLRGSPRIALELAPVVTRADTEHLRGAAVKARVEKGQKESGLPAWPAAVAAEYARRFPGTPAPATTDEQLARLVDAEPLADDVVAGLRTQRVQTVLDALSKAEGVTAERLREREGTAVVDDRTPGRVEFQLTQ